MKLQDLMVEAVAAWIEFPGYPGFEVEINILSKDEVAKLRKSCTKTKYNPYTRTNEEEVDDDKFLELYGPKVVTGWKGLKLDYLQDFLVIDMSRVPDASKTLDYSPEALVTLLKNSQRFDKWVNDMTEDRNNFRKPAAGKAVDKAEKVS